MRAKYSDLEFKHADGEIAKYELEMAGQNDIDPSVVVLRNREEQNRSVQFLELPVAQALSAASGLRVDQISIFSERDSFNGQEKYELVKFEMRGRDAEKNPLYAQTRSDIDTKKFTGEEVERYLQRADQGKTAAQETVQDPYDLSQESLGVAVPEAETQKPKR